MSVSISCPALSWAMGQLWSSAWARPGVCMDRWPWWPLEAPAHVGVDLGALRKLTSVGCWMRGAQEGSDAP